jgi:hypothetical protein
MSTKLQKSPERYKSDKKVAKAARKLQKSQESLKSHKKVAKVAWQESCKSRKKVSKVCVKVARKLKNFNMCCSFFISCLYVYCTNYTLTNMTSKEGHCEGPQKRVCPGRLIGLAGVLNGC